MWRSTKNWAGTPSSGSLTSSSMHLKAWPQAQCVTPIRSGDRRAAAWRAAPGARHGPWVGALRAAGRPRSRPPGARARFGQDGLEQNGLGGRLQTLGRRAVAPALQTRELSSKCGFATLLDPREGRSALAGLGALMSQRRAAPELTHPLGGRRRAFAAAWGRSQLPALFLVRSNLTSACRRLISWRDTSGDDQVTPLQRLLQGRHQLLRQDNGVAIREGRAVARPPAAHARPTPGQPRRRQVRQCEHRSAQPFHPLEGG